jgi:polysaccharide deacetylase family protein (PEP-CTERM system associated)
MSIDLEDWFCVHNLSQAIKYQDWDACELRVVETTRRLLDLLDRHDTQATFFVLGWIAERVPELIAEVDRRGHEIATHGYTHTLLTRMTPAEFDADLKNALRVTRKATNQQIAGFRAPSFTITPRTLWALPILTANGIRYDSSVVPISFHPDYGMPNAPLGIHRLSADLTEVPLSCVEHLGRRIPCGGGGYFRIYPYALTRHLMRRCNREGRPVIFYLHPWEIDPDQPRVTLSWQKRFRHYWNLDKTLGKLERLLTEFPFTSIRGVIGHES